MTISRVNSDVMFAYDKTSNKTTITCKKLGVLVQVARTLTKYTWHGSNHSIYCNTKVSSTAIETSLL